MFTVPALFTPVSDLIETNGLLEQASRRFEELFQALPIACFCYDLQGQIVEWNRACEMLLHFSAERVLQRNVWDIIGRPENREIMQALVQSVVSGQQYEGLEWEEGEDGGAARFFLTNTFPLLGVGGAIVGGICASVDISERKQTEQALWESEERWQLALRGNNDGIWDWNVRTGQAFFSLRWKQMLGHEEDEIGDTRDEWLRRVHPDDVSHVQEILQAHMDRQTAWYSTEHRVRCKDGTYKWILDRGQALWTRDGRVLRVAGSFTDITERKHYEEQLHEANRRLEEMATRDGLTGLRNHRAFQEHLEQEFEYARRHRDTLSLILLDVDNFKQYNDTFGHPAGDEVLKAVGRILEQHRRDGDFVARYGGEEFVVVLPSTDATDAEEAAEVWRAAIAAGDWDKRPVTASFGVATLDGSMPNRTELVTQADRALYQSKTSGRNRVTHAEDRRPAEEAA